MAESRDADSINLRTYLRVLSRRKTTLALVTLGLVVSTVVASLLQTPVYEGVAEILLQPRVPDLLFDSNGGSRTASARTVETEIRVIKSDAVRELVRDRIGAAPKVSALRVGETEVMEVRASSTSRQRAAATTNAYADAYVEFRRRQATEDALAAASEIQSKIDALQLEINALDSQISAAPGSDRAAVETRQRPRYTSLLTQQGLLSQKLDQLQVTAALNTGGAQVVRSADVPTSPVKPKPVRNGVAALAVGLVFGVGAAFLREHLDDSVKTKEDLSRALGKLPVLAAIPTTPSSAEGANARWEALLRSGSPAAEAYRSLRTSVQLLGVERPIRTIQITSAVAGEGKTTTLANLAVVLAIAGQRVAMVDCDLRRPRLHQLFGVANSVGFTSLLLGSVPLNEAVQQIPRLGQLFLLSSGPKPVNPSELLSLRRTAELVFELQNAFDIVLLDSAPVLPVTDATVLAAWVEGTLLVTKAGSTTRTEVADALKQLQQVDAPLLGAVLNQAPPEGGYGYRYEEDLPSSPGKGKGTSRRRRERGPVTAGESGRRTSTPRSAEDGISTDPTDIRARPS